ncbi:MAG: hypothetical protein KC729_00085 [Candidatus Eisenbacteria bacterium]|uniref:Uncharacterized protein n=1 Tax=Eiseniibacteriota bacterium TaxID=2212470 RepID=A0A956LVF1_UNCEI|nr:hypothetical protein [Candidatus Eisenbacteria bacterium]
MRKVLALLGLSLIVLMSALGQLQAQSAQIGLIPPIFRDQEFMQSGKLVAWQFLNPAAADTDYVHSTYGTSTSQDTSYAFTSAEVVGTAAFNVLGTSRTETFSRNITLTVSGTQANVNGGTATVYGTNVNGAAISEDFTLVENTLGTLTGSKAFYTLDSLAVNQQDGANVMVSVGIGAKLQLPVTLPFNTVLHSWCAGTPEGTAPTVATSATAIESNTIAFNTAPDGSKDYAILIWIPPFGSATAVSLW